MASGVSTTSHTRRSNRLDKLEVENRKLRTKLKKMGKRVDHVDKEHHFSDENLNEKSENISDAYKILLGGGGGGTGGIVSPKIVHKETSKPDDPRRRRFRALSPTASQVLSRSRDSSPAHVSPTQTPSFHGDLPSPRLLQHEPLTLTSPSASPRLLQRRRHSICVVPMSNHQPPPPPSEILEKVSKSAEKGESGQSERTESPTNSSSDPVPDAGSKHSESAVKITVTDFSGSEPTETTVSNVTAHADDDKTNATANASARDDMFHIPPINNRRRRNSIAVGAELKQFQQREFHQKDFQIRRTERQKSSSLERLETIGEGKMAQFRPSHHSGAKHVPAYLYPEFFHLFQTQSRGRDRQDSSTPSKPPIPEFRAAASLRPSEIQTENKGLASWLGMSKKTLKRVQDRQHHEENTEETTPKPRSIHDRRKSVFF